MTTFLVVKNRAISTLASGINNSVTSLSVASGEGANFPSTYPFHITIDDEILECTNRSTDTLTVIRAQQGTSAASHSAGASVELRITAKHIDDLTNRFTVVEKDVAYTATTSDNKILVDATGGRITISLPAADGNSELEYVIKKIDSSGSLVIIDGNGSETIDGEQTIELNSQYSYVTIVCDGTEWHIIGGINVKMEDLLIQQLDKLGEMIPILENIETHLSLGSGAELEKEEPE